MSNQDNPGPRPAMPVLPSRAAGEPAHPQQPSFSHQQPPQPYAPPQPSAPTAPPMFQDPPATPPKRKRPPAKAKPKATARLSSKEIVRLNALRKAKLAKSKKAKPVARTVRPPRKRSAAQVVRQAAANTPAIPPPLAVPARRAPGRPRKDPSARKNPNRPLELKNQMLQIVQLASKLTPAELAAFSSLVPLVQDLDRSQRKRVLDALRVVYA